MESILKVTSATSDSIVLRKCASPLKRVLAIPTMELASVQLPDCPDIDPYVVVVKNVIDLDNPKMLSDWLTHALPEGDYFIKQCRPGDSSSDRIQFGQVKVPTHGLMSVFFDSAPYYGVGVIAKGSTFAGAVLLAVCVPDFLLDSSVRGVLLIQVAFTNSATCHIVVPHHDQFCLCLHDTLLSGAEVSSRLKKWYVMSGAQDITEIVDKLPDAGCHSTP